MLKLILLLISAVALGIFASQNTTPVSLKFLSWKSHDFSLALIIILSAAVGAVMALLATFPIHHRRRRELSEIKRELEDLRERVL